MTNTAGKESSAELPGTGRAQLGESLSAVASLLWNTNDLQESFGPHMDSEVLDTNFIIPQNNLQAHSVLTIATLLRLLAHAVYMLCTAKFC